MSALDWITSRVLPSTPKPLAMNADGFFDLVSSGRRQFVLLYLDGDETAGSASLATMAERLAVDEIPEVETVDDVTERYRKRYYVSLYQTHLPELEDAEVIDWDQDEQRIYATATTASAAEAVRSMRQAMNFDSRVYDHLNRNHRKINEEDIVTMLSSERRRHLISLLSDAEPGAEVTLDWLANNITEIEFGADYNSNERKRVYVGLYQHHLPRLDTLGIVQYDDSPIVVTDRVRMLHDVMIAGESKLMEASA